jgi:hypothetical protein
VGAKELEAMSLYGDSERRGVRSQHSTQRKNPREKKSKSIGSGLTIQQEI